MNRHQRRHLSSGRRSQDLLVDSLGAALVQLVADDDALGGLHIDFEHLTETPAVALVLVDAMRASADRLEETARSFLQEHSHDQAS
jgi:hypothetical protein